MASDCRSPGDLASSPPWTVPHVLALAGARTSAAVIGSPFPRFAAPRGWSARRFTSGAAPPVMSRVPSAKTAVASQCDARVGLVSARAPDRVSDVRRGEHRARDRVEERLEAVVVGAIHHHQVDRRVTQPPCAAEPPEPCAPHDHVGKATPAVARHDAKPGVDRDEGQGERATPPSLDPSSARVPGNGGRRRSERVRAVEASSRRLPELPQHAEGGEGAEEVAGDVDLPPGAALARGARDEAVVVTPLAEREEGGLSILAARVDVVAAVRSDPVRERADGEGPVPEERGSPAPAAALRRASRRLERRRPRLGTG